MLDDILPISSFVYLLVFARVGAILVVAPGIGERTVPVRIRLLLALIITFLIAPLAADQAPAVPLSGLETFFLIIMEVFLGLFIGMIMRMGFNALQIAGKVISFQSGLAYAQNFDPTQGRQGSVIGSFLAILGVTMIFVADLHHIMITALSDSYVIFKVGSPLLFNDFASLAIDTVAKAFLIGIQIASPFIVYGLVFYLAIGLISKLMPQVQIFFIAMPLNILMGLVILMFTVGMIMTWFSAYFEDHLIRFIG